MIALVEIILSPHFRIPNKLTTPEIKLLKKHIQLLSGTRSPQANQSIWCHRQTLYKKVQPVILKEVLQIKYMG